MAIRVIVVTLWCNVKSLHYSHHHHNHSHRDQLIACYAIEGDLDSISSLNGGAVEAPIAWAAQH